MAAKKDLKYFMRSNEPEIVTVPGVEGIKDENGNVIPLEIKVLSQKQIRELYKKYEHKEIATDKKGKPLISGGDVAWKVTNDYEKAARHLMVEALQIPDLKAPELMEFYHCVDVTEMPLHVFPRYDEYEYVTNQVLSALGLITLPDDSNKELEEAKN